MTLLGTEKYLNSKNLSLADKFEMQTIPDFDADTLLATIIRNYQSLPTLFEDPDYMYEETEWWWKQHKAQYARMIQAMLAEYNPIENYDRTETRTGASTTIGNNSSEKNFSQTIDGESKKTGTETTVVDGETKGTGTITEVLDGEVKGTGTITDAHTGTDTVGTQQTTSGSTENKVSAFNESTYQPSSKIEESGSLNSTVTDTKNLQDQRTLNTKDETDNTTTVTRNTKDEVDNNTTVTHNTTDTNDVDTTSSETVEGTDSSTTNDSYTLRAHGNIGVTTNEQMVSAEILLRLKSFYGIIAKQYSDEMLLSIW